MTSQSVQPFVSREITIDVSYVVPVNALPILSAADGRLHIGKQNWLCKPTFIQLTALFVTSGRKRCLCVVILCEQCQCRCCTFVMLTYIFSFILVRACIRHMFFNFFKNHYELYS